VFCSTSTPPKVSPSPRRFCAVVFFERGSLGPGLSFCTQRSPRFSCVRLSEAMAVRCARSPSPYCSAAASCALANVRCAFGPERFSVPGSSERLTFSPFAILGIAGATSLVLG
jgi:hypothetical protein